MPVRMEPPKKSEKKLFHMLLQHSMLVAMAATLGAGSGCKPDVCKDPNVTLTAEQRCGACAPKLDDEYVLLERLNPTKLPYPVRKQIHQWYSDIRSRGVEFVTKQALKDAMQADPVLDVETKQSLADLIDHSNVMEQVDLDNQHANCMAALSAPPIVPVPPAPEPPTYPVTPASPTVPPAGSPLPASGSSGMAPMPPPMASPPATPYVPPAAPRPAPAPTYIPVSPTPPPPPPAEPIM